MIWDVLKALFPSMLVHALFFAVIAIGFFWLLRRFDVFQGAKALKPILFGAIAGIAISLLMSFDLVVKTQQSQILTSTLAAQAAAKADQNAGAANAMAAKGDFLKAIDFLTSNPDQLTVQSKTKLFEQFQPLFPKGIEDVRAYYENVRAALECQLALYEDVRATFKSKVVAAASAKTKACEERSGEFFNRPKLLGPETIEANRLMKERVLKPGPANEPKLSEKDISLLVEQQQRKLETLRKIFE